MDILARLQLRLTEDGIEPDEEILLDCMETAKTAILNRRYPFQDWPVQTVTQTINGVETTTEEVVIDSRYDDLLFRISMDLYNKIGWEGELGHSENGVSRTAESSWISESLLAEVVPYVGVPS